MARHDSTAFRSGSDRALWLAPRQPLSVPARATATLAIALWSWGAAIGLAACSGIERPAHAAAASQQRAQAQSHSPLGEPAPGTSRESDATAQRSACDATPSPIPSTTQQLIVVSADGFDTWHAKLQRFERAASGAWSAVGEPIPVVLGRSGYAWGDGLHGSGAPAGRPGAAKREGDGRSPAGVFALGTVHGYRAAAPSGLSLPYRQANAAQRCVDDPRSTQYNRIVEPGPQGATWSSAERMRRDDAAYELALDIEHNRAPVVAGHGSCIFAHVWVNPETPVAGCTGMALPVLQDVLTWIKPGALWVALPVQEYEALRACWKLPESR